MGFELIHWFINLSATSSSKIFNEFDHMFLSNVLLVSINKTILFKKNDKILTFLNIC